MSGSARVIETLGLGKRYRLGVRSHDSIRDALASVFRGSRQRAGHSEIWALRDVDLAIDVGESVGVIGRNGSGKSTLLKLLSRITAPTTGRARIRGRVGTLLEVGTGFHPELTGTENVYLNGSVLGMSRREIRRRFDEIVDFAGVDGFLDTPLKRYSSGMQLRLAFAVAAHLEPEILIVDEVLAVGDLEFQRRCLGRMEYLAAEGRTVLFVSHDLQAITRLCKRAIWLDGGRKREDGAADAIAAAYAADVPGSRVSVSQLEDASSPVRVTGISVLDADTRSTAAIRRDRALAIEVELVTEHEQPDLDIAIWIANRRGERIVDDAWSDRPDGAAVLPSGQLRATVVVPPVLTPGVYSVGVWLGTQLADFSNREYLRFELPPHPSDQSWQIERKRTVQPELEWRIARLDAPVGAKEGSGA